MTSQYPSILMVSDFFYPGLGGVENHILQLGLHLIRLGYKVIVATNQKDKRKGIRWFEGVTFPSAFCFLPLLREIIIREGIQIVHAHQATSNLGDEALFHSKLLGCRQVFTDHSLFGFSELGGNHVNKILEVILAPCHRAICVSHASRENLVLRGRLDPARVSVIPNALEPDAFTPDPSKLPSPPRIRVVVISRMTFRKGVDLLVGVVPIVCQRCPNVEFVIGGDGPKRICLEEMRETHRLHDRVQLLDVVSLGSVPHHKITEILQSGQIFLNCSLTEAFCIAIIEAASCGMRVVSTNVGGIPEVLPETFVRFTNPTVEDLANNLVEEIQRPPRTREEIMSSHEFVRSMYTWKDVAARTAIVYKKVMEEPPCTLWNQLRILYDCGPVLGKLWSLLTLFDAFLIYLFEWYRPRKTIHEAISLR